MNSSLNSCALFKKHVMQVSNNAYLSLLKADLTILEQRKKLPKIIFW